MKWLKFRIETTEEAEDILISDLYDCGLEGAQIEDKQPLSALDKERMFVDILPDVLPDDGKAYLSFFVEAPADDGEKKKLTEETLAKIKEVLDDNSSFFDIGSGNVEVSETEDIDWINNWKQYFHQFYVDDMLIIPSWEEMKEEDQDKLVIHIDPGTAFGTGMHETTQLCLRQLKKYVNSGTQILDVGTGSGILSIAALKLGAAHAVGTDLDPCVLPATKENMEANDIPADAMDVMIGNLIDDPQVQEKVGFERYDIVAANILADVLIMLTPQVVRHMKSGGVYITSGILDVKEQAVAEAIMAAGLHIIEVTRQGEWVCITAGKA